jgi:divalent metal cation (Fe/Co/Zn/Cd) transporter
VSFDAAVGQGHAVADAVERAVQSALPEADVVVHVEPRDEAAVRERAHAAALGVRRVREVHNVSVLSVGGGTELSLHIKLPGDLSLDDAHEIAEEVERAIREAVPEIDAVQTHLEPLTEESAGVRPRAQEVADDRDTVARIVRETTGHEPAELRFLHTDEGLVAYLTLHLTGVTALADAHAQASRIEEQIRRERPEIADVIVHTEPQQ